MSALPALREPLAPAVADQWESDALVAIERVETPEAAESLLAQVRVAEEAIRLAELGRDRERRWARVRLLAERKYGELLGPAMTPQEAGAVRGSDSSSAERERARRAA
jgi:hypothetical protein